MRRILFILFLVTLGYTNICAHSTSTEVNMVDRPYIRVHIIDIVEPIDIPMYDGMDCTVDPIALRVHGPEGWLGFNFPHVESFSYITKSEPAAEAVRDNEASTTPGQELTSVTSATADYPTISLADKMLTITRTGNAITCAIYDMNGTKVQQGNGCDIVSISLTDMTPGIYVAVINNNLTFKICVK